MRLRLAGSVLLLAAAWYVYLPLPSGVNEPWKLMVIDALLRGLRIPCHVANTLGCYTDYCSVKSVLSRMEIEARSCHAVHVTDSTLGGLPTRVFQAKGGKKLKRGVIYFHGGGWALSSGRMQQYDHMCRKMAEDLDAVVMSVDYRLAPDALFPDQYNDALAASRAFLSAEVLERYSIDPERLCVSGDSAGGNLAAAVAQELGSDDSLTVKFKVQALIYPALQALDFNTPSYQQNQEVPFLSRVAMVNFWVGYLGANSSLVALLLDNKHSSLDQPTISADIRSRFDWTSLLPPERKGQFRPVVQETGSLEVVGELPALTDVRAAPLLADQRVLSMTPKAYVLTVEFDPLRDDGLMYVKRLQDAGVTVTSDHYDDGFHGCLLFTQWAAMLDVGQRSLNNYIRWLDQNL